jgi:hypothetical protein
MHVVRLDRPMRASWPAGAVFLGLACVVGAAGWALMTGPRLQATEEQQAAAQMDAETEAACQRLGMPKGSAGFDGCAAELRQVRQHHEERLGRPNSLL